MINLRIKVWNDQVKKVKTRNEKVIKLKVGNDRVKNKKLEMISSQILYMIIAMMNSY